ncbi:MAG: ImmA/IrrE family metallo-endopeptidase [Kofleriaceae bacterium]
MQTEWIRDAQRSAKGLLHRFGVRAAEHIRVESFAAKLGVAIVETPLDGASAQLVRAGARTTIMVSARITDPAARRFSIAHELGHFVLDHPSRPPSELCTPYAHRTRERDFEAEANAFAAELLMPGALLRRACEIAPVDLEVPRRIARDYEVSILASAIRFAELASERCAAVFSTQGKVKWVAPSPTFIYEIARGRPLDRGSLAWDYFANRALPDEPQPVRADAWVDTSRDLDLVEHSICSHELRTVLTMLWLP